MIESKVEKILTDGIKAMGGIAFKFVSPGNNGVPDRLIVLPGGRVYFVELKTDTGRLSEPQKRQIERLRFTGADVHVLYGEKDVKEFLEYVRGWCQ